ncbi:MAG: class I SAM-dependent methyltransferase [Acidobacteria bacterium]|nr:class I SAM-dependent methyltransferase [Acidobacteriota bacterium]
MIREEESRAAYIEWLKQCLMGTMYEEERPVPTPAELAGCAARQSAARQKFSSWLARPGGVTPPILEKKPRELWLLLRAMRRQRAAQTMTVRSGVDNVHYCLTEVLEGGVPGDVMEAGVWKGGLTILIQGILKAWGVNDRRVWVADSFAGLPEPDPETDLEDAVTHYLLGGVDHLRISQAEVRSAFEHFDLLDDQVCFLPGWFRDTLPAAPVERLALLRVDGDWHDSTRDCLRFLYPKLAVGGYMIIDDYGLPLGCRRAVDEYRLENRIREPLQWVNMQTVFWRREE